MRAALRGGAFTTPPNLRRGEFLDHFRQGRLLQLRHFRGDAAHDIHQIGMHFLHYRSAMLGIVEIHQRVQLFRRELAGGGIDHGLPHFRQQRLCGFGQDIADPLHFSGES